MRKRIARQGISDMRRNVLRERLGQDCGGACVIMRSMVFWGLGNLGCSGIVISNFVSTLRKIYILHVECFGKELCVVA